MAAPNGAVLSNFKTVQLNVRVQNGASASGFVIIQQTWQVPAEYEKLQLIGSGAYGSVASAVDRNTGKKLAIKRLAHPFRSDIDAKRAYRELRLLRHMNHDNVIGLLHAYTPQSLATEMQEIYFVTPFMETDLHKTIRTQELTDEHLRYLIYQLLRGLMDLKPANIAVNSDCGLRILDFGLARQAQETMTQYVVTRWYRPPEILLEQHYSYAADIWSVGCILGEMIRREPLFPTLPHAAPISQLDLILDLVGTPSERHLQHIQSEIAKNYIRSKPQKLPKDFRLEFPNATPNALDLLQRMLEFDPSRRITAEQALAHEYLHDYNNPQAVPVVHPFDNAFEHLELSINQWRERIFQEIQTFQARQ